MQTGRARNEVIGLENVSLFYPSKTAEVHALDGISLAAADREFVALLGPSGCGKSTLLKLIAGLIPQSSGVIRINGTRISGPTPSIVVVTPRPDPTTRGPSPAAGSRTTSRARRSAATGASIDH